MVKNLHFLGICLCLHPYIGLEIPIRPPTIAALKITWKPWRKFMKTVLKGYTDFFAPMLSSEAGNRIRRMALPKRN